MVILNGTLTARRYVDKILQSVLVPLMQQHRHGSAFIFQQDNARAHTRLTKKCPQTNSINVLDCAPTMSYVGRRVRSSQPQNQQELGRALLEDGQNISQMSVINANGGLAQYLRP